MTENPIAAAFAADPDAPTLLDAWHNLQKCVREATAYLEQLGQLRDQALEADDIKNANALEAIIEDLRSSLSDVQHWP